MDNEQHRALSYQGSLLWFVGHIMLPVKVHWVRKLFPMNELPTHNNEPKITPPQAGHYRITACYGTSRAGVLGWCVGVNVPLAILCIEIFHYCTVTFNTRNVFMIDFILDFLCFQL